MAAHFNEAAYQSILDMLPRERVQRHVVTLAGLVDDVLVSNDDFERGRAAVHKLISVAGTLGFERLASSCQRVEAGLAEGTSRSCPQLELRRAALAARPIIEALLARA